MAELSFWGRKWQSLGVGAGIRGAKCKAGPWTPCPHGRKRGGGQNRVVGLLVLVGLG